MDNGEESPAETLGVLLMIILSSILVWVVACYFLSY